MGGRNDFQDTWKALLPMPSWPGQHYLKLLRHKRLLIHSEGKQNTNGLGRGHLSNNSILSYERLMPDSFLIKSVDRGQGIPRRQGHQDFWRSRGGIQGLDRRPEVKFQCLLTFSAPVLFTAPFNTSWLEVLICLTWTVGLHLHFDTNNWYIKISSILLLAKYLI